MTQLLHQDRLRLIAATIRHPGLLPPARTPTLRWVLDASTGRPVAHWELAEKRDPVQLAPECR